MRGRNGSVPDFGEDEESTSREMMPLPRRVAILEREVDEGAEERGKILASQARLEASQDRVEADIRDLRRRVSQRSTRVRQGAQVGGVVLLVVLEVLRAAGVPLPQIGGQQQPAAPAERGGR